MTAINRLTQVQSLSDNDLFPLWDTTNGRTRNVRAETLKEYASADEVVNAEIVDDHLILIKENGSRIDAGELPSHTGIHVEDSGNDKGNFTRINFAAGLNVETDGVTATVSDKTADAYVLDLNTYGDFNNLQPWLILWEEIGADYKYVIEGEKVKFINTPLEIDDYLSSEYKVTGTFSVNDSTPGKKLVTHTFRVYEHNRSHEFSRLVDPNDPEEISKAEWHILTGLQAQTEMHKGDNYIIPVSKIKSGSGMIFDYQGDELIINSSGAYNSIRKISGSYAIVDDQQVQTVYYSTPNYGEQHEITFAPVTDFSEKYVVTIICANATNSTPIISIPSQGINTILSRGQILEVRVNPLKTDEFEVINISGDPPLSLESTLADFKNILWDSVTLGRYYLQNVVASNLHPDIDGQTITAFVDVFGGYPVPFGTHSVTIATDNDLNGRTFVRGFYNNAPSTVDFKEIGSGGSGGLPDNGYVDNLTTSFEDLEPGKWYIDGWENTSGLPDWPSQDRIASFINFGGFDGATNGAGFQLFSHRQGVWAAPKSSGVTGPWVRLDDDPEKRVITSQNPLEFSRDDTEAKHDAISVSGQRLRVGSPQGQLELRSNSSRVNIEADGVNQTLAYLSDIEGAEPQYVFIQKSGTVAAGEYLFQKDGEKSDDTDFFTYNWDDNEHSEMIPLIAVKQYKAETGNAYTIPSTGGRLVLDYVGDEYKLIVSSSISGIGFVGYTVRHGSGNVSGTSGIDPADGFTLKKNRVIGLSEGSKLLYEVDGSPAEVIAEPTDTLMLFGDSSKQAQIRSSGRLQLKTGLDEFFHVAFEEENHIPNVEWERSTEPRELTADELYQYIDFVFEPLGAGHVAHLVMPERSTWESKFWISDVNDDKKDKLPSIEHWRMAFTMPKEKIAVTENHKLRLTSKDGLTNFSQDGTDVITGVLGKRWVAFWAKPKESAPSGWAGWVMKFSPDEEEDFTPYTTYEAQGEVAYSGVPSNQQNQIIDGVGYVSINRQAPVVTTDETTDNLQLIQLNAAETETSLPTVKKVLPGTLASGFSLCADGTVADTQILQVASGTYSLTTMAFASAAAVGDGVYVDENGKLTLTESDYQCGWVIADGVVIDVDLYNSSINGAGTDDNPVVKTLGIDTNGSGQPNFTATFRQDNELHTVIDATRELRVNYKDIGTGTTTGVMGIDNNQAQFLVPLYVGNDQVALAKDIPVIPDNGYIETYTRADTDYVQVAYQGKYDDDRVYYPVSFSQDVNGWTQLRFTGNMVFHCNSKDTGGELSKPFEIRQSRVVHNVQPYYGDDKLATRTNNHIANTANFNGLITTSGKTVSEWISENPDYTPAQLLDVIFDSKVLGSADWVVSLTASNNTYNGTIPSGYSQWELHKTGGSARNFMRVYHKESHTVYFAPHLAGQDPEWKKYAFKEDVSTEIDDKIAADKAKGIWIGGVIKDTLNDDGNPGDQLDCGNPKHWIEFRKTAISGDRFLVLQDSSVTSSEIVVHLHVSSGMTSCNFRIQNATGQYQDKTIRIGEKWRFFLRQGVYPYSEKIDDGMSSGGASSDYDGEGFGVPGRTETGSGTIVQKVITGNYRNTSNETGDLIINLRTDDGVKNFRFYYSLPHGTLSGRKVFAKVDQKAGSSKTIRAGEIWQCEIKAGQFFDDFFWQKITDGESTFVLEEDFNAKSGYNKLVSGGGSTYTVTYGESGSILKISNPTVKVQLLQGMSDETPHGYIKYINSRNADVAFEWYDRNGNQVTSNVPSVCPADTVVEIFADYAKDQYVLNFGQSKVISTAAETAEMINNQATVDLICKTRYGNDCMYLNTLTAEV